MNKSWFPLIAFVISLGVLLAVTAISDTGSGAPVSTLTLLFMTEFGLLAAVGGTYFGLRILLANGFMLKSVLPTLGCVVLVVLLAVRGYGIWQAVA